MPGLLAYKKKYILVQHHRKEKSRIMLSKVIYHKYVRQSFSLTSHEVSEPGRGKCRMKCWPLNDILTFGTTGKAELSAVRTDRSTLSRKFLGTLVC
jgi:hypothetical protein